MLSTGHTRGSLVNVIACSSLRMRSLLLTEKCVGKLNFPVCASHTSRSDLSETVGSS